MLILHILPRKSAPSWAPQTRAARPLKSAARMRAGAQIIKCCLIDLLARRRAYTKRYETKLSRPEADKAKVFRRTATMIHLVGRPSLGCSKTFLFTHNDDHHVIVGLSATLVTQQLPARPTNGKPLASSGVIRLVDGVRRRYGRNSSSG